MADMIANKDAVAAKANESAPTVVDLQGTSITGPLLFVTSFAIGAFFVVETIFGLLWALGGEFRTYVAFLQ